MNNKTVEVFKFFQQISSIPRCSKNEEKISAWIIQWAIEKSFGFKKDNAGNLVITVPASPGLEKAPGIIIQGHMDMVCEKTPDSDHDFSKDPLELIFENGWIKARKTTLGADNGIGLALAMALASDKTIIHPKLELLFTVDEETGLTGAGNLQEGWLEGKVLLNIDSEDDDVFIIGCAGGNDTRIKLNPMVEPVPKGLKAFRLKVHGLCGGHSGLNIHEQRANAIKIMARCLSLLLKNYPVFIISINGGNAHNAIPREAKAEMASGLDMMDSIAQAIQEFEKIVRQEYEAIEPDMKITFEKTDTLENISPGVLSKKDAFNLVHLLCSLPHGVYNMSYKIPGLVETSSNLAAVHTQISNIEIITSQRSNIMSRLSEITDNIKAVCFLAGAKTMNQNAYPAWQPRMDSFILSRCVDVYSELFGNKPKVEVIHAGLECGVIGSKYPDLDMISFGPTIKGAHSPEEKLNINSVEKIYNFLEALISTDF